MIASIWGSTITCTGPQTLTERKSKYVSNVSSWVWICFTSFFCNFPPLLFCLHCHFFSFNFLQKFGSLGYRHAKSVRNCKIWTGRAGMWKVTSIIYFQWWFSQKNLANAKKGAFNKNVNGRRLCKTGDQPCCSQFAPVNLGDKISKILLKETHLKSKYQDHYGKKYINGNKLIDYNLHCSQFATVN